MCENDCLWKRYPIRIEFLALPWGSDVGKHSQTATSMDQIVGLSLGHPQVTVGRTALVLILVEPGIVLPETDRADVPIAAAIERLMAADKTSPLGHLDSPRPGKK
jgi:hypothetical protein